MSLLAAERIKLLSTRSPWWCMALATVLTVGFTAMFAAFTAGKLPMTVSGTQASYNLGLMVIMVMAALAVTTEYRFNTIRTTFQAVPNRTAAILAKVTVVVTLAGVAGEVIAFLSWGVAKIIQPAADLAISTGDDWRAVAGVGLVFAISAVIAMAVGIVVRHTAGTVAIVLIYSLLVESLIVLIPTVGSEIYQWLPFRMAGEFLRSSTASNGRVRLADAPFGPWGSLAYFAGIATLMLLGAIIVVNKRDA